MNKLYKLLSRVLDIDETSITDSTSPDTVESWDSFNALVLVSELEKEFSVKFTMEEIQEVKNVGDIKACLKKHNIDFEK